MAATILELFENRVNESSSRTALRRIVEQDWAPMSWKEWFDASERLAAGLIEVGIQPGDRVAIIGETRTEWLVADIAILMTGAVSVPVYPSLGAAASAQILADAEVAAAVVADPSQLDKIVAHRDELPSLRHVAWMDAERVRATPDHRGRTDVRIEDVISDDDPWNVSLEDLGAAGRRALSQDTLVVARRRQNVSADDLASIVYTSGTTGAPRGVMLTHRNFAAQVDTLTRLELFSANDVQYLFLPLAHIFARILSLASIGYGIEMALAEDPRRLVAEMQATRPTFFAAVPQIFEQIRTKIEAEATRDPLRGRIFKAAETVGRQAERARKDREPGFVDRARRKLLDEITPGRLQGMFGGQLRFAISGGAPLSVDTAEFFAVFGVDILEGYGLTETTAVATLNIPGDSRAGSVGRPLPGVDVTIDEDGEILVRGATISAGYWRDEASTRESRDDDGWFRTGDLGSFDRDGFLFITGRKKELIVTAGGKNVAPTALEAALESIPLVRRAYVHGDRRPFVVALLELDPDQAAAYVRDSGGDVDEWLAAAIAEVNANTPGHGAVREWAVVEEPFGEETGEVTPTGKLRREIIADRRADLISSLYQKPG